MTRGDRALDGTRNLESQNLPALNLSGYLPCPLTCLLFGNWLVLVGPSVAVVLTVPMGLLN